MLNENVVLCGHVVEAERAVCEAHKQLLDPIRGYSAKVKVTSALATAARHVQAALDELASDGYTLDGYEAPEARNQTPDGGAR